MKPETPAVCQRAGVAVLGEDAATPTATCEWADCSDTARVKTGGFRYCWTHHREHEDQLWHSRKSDRGRPGAQHGTPSGYRRHLRLKLVACDDCLRAWREAATTRRRAAGVPARRAA